MTVSRNLIKPATQRKRPSGPLPLIGVRALLTREADTCAQKSESGTRGRATAGFRFSRNNTKIGGKLVDLAARSHATRTKHQTIYMGRLAAAAAGGPGSPIFFSGLPEPGCRMTGPGLCLPPANATCTRLAEHTPEYPAFLATIRKSGGGLWPGRPVVRNKN